MSDQKSPTDNPNPSIAEESIEQYKRVSDSIAGLIAERNLGVRDFVLLSFACDQGPMEVDQLASVLTLDHESTLEIIERLKKSGLVQLEKSATEDDVVLISTTILGMSLIKKIDNANS